MDTFFRKHLLGLLPLRSSPGLTLVELIGVIAVLAILAAALMPNVIRLLHRQATEKETGSLMAIGHGVELYLRRNLTFPPTLASLSPDYVPLSSNQLTQNERGYLRYLSIHPTMSGFSNASGISTSDLVDARFLLISNLRQDAAPTITTAGEFETWWTTDESITPDLHLYRGNVGDFFHLMTITANGSGGSYQINGSATNSGGSNLTTHTKYHVTGTGIRFDEANTYGLPEVTFALTTNVAYWFNPDCATGSQWNPVDPTCRPSTLWLTTAGNVSGAPGIGSWTNAQIVNVVQPNLTYDGGPTSITSGTFGLVFDIENFTASANVDALHYVTNAITIGTTNTVDVLIGDVLLSTTDSVTVTSTNTLLVDMEDVFVFRPDIPGNYSAGTFIMLIDGSDLGLVDIDAMTLVEYPTVVGGTTLGAGTFLWANDSQNVDHFIPTSAGTVTSGTSSLFIDGLDISLDSSIDGLDVVEVKTTVGDATLDKGRILATLLADDNIVGDNGIVTKEDDIFVLDLTTTGSVTAGNALLLFDGSDVGMSSGGEEIDGLTLQYDGS